MDEIAVRAYTVPKIVKNVPKTGKSRCNFIPNRMLVFDTETTVDLYQNLKFGFFEIFQDDKLEHQGLFYDPNTVKQREKIILEQYCTKNSLKLYNIEEFREIFLYEVFELHTICVGFNLPFDLTRIAIKSTNTRLRHKNGFSLVLSSNLNYPRLHITHVTSTLSFIEWGKLKNKAQSFHGNFLDLRTLCFALTNKKFSLENACEAFNTEYQKKKVTKHGIITPKYINYCISDVKATYSLYCKAQDEFRKYNLDILIIQAYTPATVGKQFLKQMGVKPFLEQNKKFPNKIIGYTTTAYFGGRTETRIRKKPTLVDVLDFLSMYPTVCTLQNLWKFVIAEKIIYIDATKEIRDFIENFQLEDVQCEQN